METEAIAAPANPRRSRRVRPRDWYAEDSVLLDFIDTELRLQASLTFRLLLGKSP
jgi:hypothetical protein